MVNTSTVQFFLLAMLVKVAPQVFDNQPGVPSCDSLERGEERRSCLTEGDDAFLHIWGVVNRAFLPNNHVIFLIRRRALHLLLLTPFRMEATN